MKQGKVVEKAVKINAMNRVINGENIQQVAKETGVCAGTVYGWIAKMKKSSKRKVGRKVRIDKAKKPRSDWLNDLFERTLKETIKETINEMIRER